MGGLPACLPASATRRARVILQCPQHARPASARALSFIRASAYGMCDARPSVRFVGDGAPCLLILVCSLFGCCCSCLAVTYVARSPEIDPLWAGLTFLTKVSSFIYDLFFFFFFNNSSCLYPFLPTYIACCGKTSYLSGGLLV